MSGDYTSRISRRRLLQASGGAIGPSFVGTGRAADDDEDRGFGRCPDATLEPSMDHCEGASVEGCADDHPETERLRAAVAESLETEYPTVGALLDQGFVPYFDVFRSPESDGYSHWLSPEFIDDGGTLDPERPEAVLVDNEWWQPIGTMFVATRYGEPMDEPPTVYGEDPGANGEEGGTGAADDPCSPWHVHLGLPGRAAWWYYRQAYEGDYRRGNVALPCETPCMLHVWTVPHPESVYAHDPPPREYRRHEPADPGFETDAEPGTDDLEYAHLPEAVVPDPPPRAVARRFR